MKTYVSNILHVDYDDSGSGLPVVLLHAFPVGRGMWRPQRESLSGSCRILAPDLRGFGGTSGFDDAPSVERMADDVASFLEALNIRIPVVVGGLSMGGYVALAFARRHVAKLRGLILADTKAEADTPEAKANRNTLIASMQSTTAADLAEQMIPKLLGETTRRERPQVAEEVRRLSSAQSAEAIAKALMALRDRPDATSGLEQIGVPTLVVVGSEDSITPPSVASAMAARIPGAQLEVIHGAGHLANLEDPGNFNRVVGAFLTKHF